MTDDTSPTTANSAMKADSPTIIDDSNPDNWWKQAVIYQIYPRSFADENGDGLGGRSPGWEPWTISTPWWRPPTAGGSRSWWT